jgi:Acetyltransferase (GNAT) domain
MSQHSRPAGGRIAAMPRKPDAAGLPAPVADGLVLRRATSRDVDALTGLQASVQADPGGNANAAASAWAGDLLSGAHPTVNVDDTSVVEDPRTGALVSSLTLVRQTWSYAGIPVGVGRIELVATDARYRRRGLVSRQLELLHGWSAERGDLLQVITDLMFFHGELGYQMALTQRTGRGGDTRALPRAGAGGEPVTLRPAVRADIPAFLAIDKHLRDRVLLSCLRDERQWAYELDGRSAESMMRDKVHTVLAGSRPAGYVVTGYGGIPTFPIPEWFPGSPRPERAVSVASFELLPGICWLDVAPSMLRQLTARPAQDGYMLWLGTDHPAYTALGNLLYRRPPTVSWFVRAAEPARFIAHIGPALEARLAGSAASNFTGMLRLHLYTSGLLLRFDEGHLVHAGPWAEPSRRASDASMPEQMFLQLLLGHAAFADVAVAFPDCRLQTLAGQALLPVLFPRQASAIWPLA